VLLDWECCARSKVQRCVGLSIHIRNGLFDFKTSRSSLSSLSITCYQFGVGLLFRMASALRAVRDCARRVRLTRMPDIIKMQPNHLCGGLRVKIHIQQIGRLLGKTRAQK
jgi:hypothetical protein